MTDSIALENKYELSLYPKRGINIVKGKNATLWDSEGKEYIDCVGGIGVASVGHCNEYVAKAIAVQAQILITCPCIFHNDVRALLLEKLVNITPAGVTRAFLCNSGTESIEAAIKFARYSTKMTDFICAVRGFHGRTMGSLSATYNPKYRAGYEPFVPGFYFVPFNDFEKLKEKISDNTAGVILEIVQGEGGIHVGDKEYFRKVQELCSDSGILLIIDEVQTGFCRTGKMFACNHFDIEPDILCLAKAIAGGFPMGAVLCSAKIDLPAGKHGSTNGGNPLACAAALAAIDYMLEFKLDKQAADKGAYFIDLMKKRPLDKIREIRNLGLMIGIELKEENKPYIQKLMEKGVLVMPAGPNVLRMLPPLTIEYEQIDRVVEALSEIL
ncbi:acetylornithine aminotransferase [bacterium SM23_31]|nr:MAG: acetylornithine aminotransferase [bacterium SM23_31]